MEVERGTLCSERPDEMNAVRRRLWLVKDPVLGGPALLCSLLLFEGDVAARKGFLVERCYGGS